MNNYRIISDIGSGAYSTVHKAIDVTTGQVVAIKKISQQNMNIKHIINRQVTFLHQCINHPNIIQLYKCFTQGNYTFLVFQYMPMDLISYYKSVQQSKKRNLTDDEICFISYQLCKALKFLHEKNIMHRDIKPENILIDPDTLNIKLIDFGFAKLSNTPNNTNYMVTRWYRPLEIVLNLPYNEKVDVFAVGALILQLYLGNEVFRSGSNIDQFYWIVNICGFPQKWTKAHEVIAKMNLKVQKSTPRLKDLMNNIRPLAADLLTKMLNASPQQRITTQQAYEHPYFSRFKIRNVVLFTKNPSSNEKKLVIDDSSHYTQNLRNMSMKRTRAFSTQQQPHIINNLSSRQYRQKNYTDVSQVSDEAKNGMEIMATSAYTRTKTNEQNPDVKSVKQEYRSNGLSPPKKHYLKRVSQEKQDNVNFKSRQYLQDNIQKHKIQQKANTIRNRVRSLNQHGINVVSLKKLKVHRQIDEKKEKLKDSRSNYKDSEQIRLNNKKQKEKPMFLRVKEKINDGVLNEEGQQILNSVSGRKASEIPTKILSSAAQKVKKYANYKEYRFND